MPRLTVTPPKYRKHKRSGQAVVTLNGRDYYLGPHGSKTSRAEYDRVISEWLVNGRRVPGAADDNPQLVITELIAAYWEWAQTYYLKSGKPTSEQASIRIALRHLRKLYGHTPAVEFGPLALKALRQYLIDRNDSRKYIGHHIDRVKRLFKWAVEHEMVPPSIYHGLQAVVGLRKGRSAARETEPVKPVAVEHIEVSKPFLSRQVWAMIQIELLAGMRPGEDCIMRACEIEMTCDVWNYRPHNSKTEHHDIERVVPLGQQAQAIVREFLKPDSRAYLFSPIHAEAERRTRLHAGRKTPPKYGNRPSHKTPDSKSCAAARRAL